MALTPGANLDGYEILGPLGAGGMGEVYRARDPVLKREVAIKVLPAYVSQDPDRLRRFEQEAQAAAALNHPNILAVHRFGTFEGSPYLVSELLEGSTLGQLLARGPLLIRKTIDYSIQIARGLAAAHEKGFVHRDLKPENILITKDGRAKILDFGLAKLTQTKAAAADGPTVSLQEQTNPGQVLGTVGYMSPEQVRGKAADHRADLFAFGAILYEMLTGNRAFKKPTSTETMTAILNEDPPAISQISPSTSTALLRIVHRCLEKNPAQRYQSASDLAFALEALSDSGSSSAAAINQGSSSRWIWILGAGAVVALAAALIAWWKIPPAVPVVESVTQLTDDGEPKRGILASDGSRIYFNEGQTGSYKIAQVSVTGGRTALIETTLADPRITGLAPEGSGLLALEGGWDVDSPPPLWSIPLPAGEPRRLGSAEGQDADFFPDGRILVAREKDLYVANKDGSNLSKLASFAGDVRGPRVSPDGKRIVLTVFSADETSLVEIAADGTGLRTILNAACCAAWTADGEYLVYSITHQEESDLWALPMRTGLLRSSRKPVRLAAGPLFYSGARPSRDGKQVFAIGTKRRGELVRYDLETHQFVPFLSGISAIDPTFSRDGQWVAYTSYPDHTLWRSRSDGTERRQLTYPPMEVGFPFISPDGRRVAFMTSHWDTYVINVDGGTPQRVVARDSAIANWSTDGNLLVFYSVLPDVVPGGIKAAELKIFDLRTGEISVVPFSRHMVGAYWIMQDELVAANEESTKLLTFDFKTQKWTEIAHGTFANWNVSPDRRYLYLTTGGAEPKVQRLRFADRQIETITSLKGFRRVVDPVDTETRLDVAPDGSPVFTRDIGTQEIYALSIRWP